MAKNSIFTPLAVVLVVVGLFSSGVNAQCKTTLKQRLLGAAIVGGLSAAAGSAMSYDRAKGAAIGAAVGAPLGAAMSKNTHCVQAQQAAAKSFRPAPIAPASAPEPEVMAGPPVIIHSVYGANQQALTPVINQGLAKQGYSLIDTQIYRSQVTPDWYLDVNVVTTGNSNGWGGGGFNRSSFSAYGNGAVTGGYYQVAVTMTDAKSGRQDPSRSRIMNIRSVVYSSGNGYVTISNLEGYGGHSYQTNDPATGAAEEAIAYFFGLQ